MHVPHVFVDPADCDDRRVRLQGPVAHHVLTVLRCGPGDAVSVADGTGTVRTARIADLDGASADCTVEEVDHAPPRRPWVRVVCGLPKRRKLDDVVQRLTELGVDEIVPAHTDRSQVRLDGPRAHRATQRWRAVACAAAQQSRRTRLPTIAPVTAWHDAFTGAGHGVIFWEDAPTPLRDIPLDVRVDWITVGVGPEGGLTADEVEQTSLPPADLGATILRAETAGVVAPALVLQRLGRLG